MFKNRFLLVIGVLSVLLASVTISNPLSKGSVTVSRVANDFYQRHLDWNWENTDSNASIPVTGDVAYTDYAERHPGLSLAAGASIDTSDYFFRHPELGISMNSTDLSDYFLRHPEFKNR